MSNESTSSPPRPNWRREYAFVVPPKVNSVLYLAFGHSGSLRPFGDCKRFSVQGQEMIIAAISRLFRFRRPSAIAGFIVSACVWVAVNAVPFTGTFSHVGEESLKGIAPAVADENAATAVPIESCRVLAFAAVNHRPPTLIGRASSHSVRNTSLSRYVENQTTATAFIPSWSLAHKLRAGGDRSIAAVAKAFPHQQGSLISTGEANDLKATETAARQVGGILPKLARRLGGLGRIEFSHDEFLSSEGAFWLEPTWRSSAAPARFIVAQIGGLSGIRI